MSHRIESPTAGRKIIIDSALYNRLIRDGYLFRDDPENNTLTLTQKDLSILDTDIPDIRVEPLKPTPFQQLKNKVVDKARKMTNRLRKIVENQKKNANEVVDCILAQKDKIVKRILPVKIQELIELSKRTPYNSKNMYWKINMPSNPQYESLIIEKLEKVRLKYEKEYFSKYLKMYYYNDVTSLDYVHKNLMKTYKDENNAFKLLLSFDYITEKKKENDMDDYEIKLYEPSQQYFYDTPKTIKNKKDMNNLVSNINGDKIIHKLASQLKTGSKTRLIGVYSMAVKVIRLDYPIGSKIQLPDYIKKSNFIVGLEDVENNFCFWACLALAEGCTKNRCTKKAKELFNNFYRKNVKKFDDYKGFDFVNELDKYEAFNVKYAINIVCYNEDGSIEYVRRSVFNPDRTSIYLNLYLDHFSYIPNLEKLSKMYICNRCSSKFDNNFNLERHIDTCNLEQKDSFVKYPQIYEKKRNDIVELCDWFDIQDCDYKYDYLITFDLEAMAQKMQEFKEGSKLKFTTRHIPVSTSIATNVPGFETEYFILSTNPNDLAGLMFQYFDKVAEEATELKWKM